MNYGFRESILDDTQYVLGGLGVSKQVLNPNLDWKPFLPQGEVQRRSIETSSCTEFGTINGIETLENKVFGRSGDYSERAVAIGAGNNQSGNDPHTVCEYIRHNGLISESSLPFTDALQNFDEYLSPSPLPRRLLLEAKKWLNLRSFKHEWVFTPSASRKEKRDKLLEALKYSPVGVSVDAWHERDGIFYKEGVDNHWCLLVNAQGNLWEVFDTYLEDGQYIKRLDFDYDFGCAKLFILNKVEKQSLFARLLRYIKWMKDN